MSLGWHREKVIDLRHRYRAIKWARHLPYSSSSTSSASRCRPCVLLALIFSLLSRERNGGGRKGLLQNHHPHIHPKLPFKVFSVPEAVPFTVVLKFAA